ncbi:branched-chain amino acid transaminase [soil metagenome]
MYYDKNLMVFFDGKWLKANSAKTNLFSQTLHYGNGVFEGIRSYQTQEGTQIFKAKEHFKRLLSSAAKMYIQLEYTPEELTEISYKLLKKNNLTNAYIRPLVFLGENMALSPTQDVHLVIMAWEWERYLGSNLLRVTVSPYLRPHPQSCHVEAKVVGHYTNSILATTEAKSRGFDEALLLDHMGFVAEGPGTNFFFEKDEVLYTPPAGNILPGITRATIIDLAYKTGIRVEEKHFTIEEVKNADSAFFTGTASEVIGIKSIDDEVFTTPWEDTVGYSMFLMYMHKVMNKEFQDFTLV